MRCVANVDDPFPFLFEDNHLLFVHKPAGLLTQESGTGRSSLEGELRAYLKVRDHKPGAAFLHAVHRLDGEASGIVLFAKSRKALQRLNQQVKEREVNKRYRAWIHGDLPKERGRLIHWLAHRSHRAQVVAPHSPAGKEARLSFSHLGKGILEVELETGRYHQIRCQLSEMGCPIRGDRLYGSQKRWPKGIALQHVSMEVTHPTTQERLRVQAPLDFS